MELNSGFRLSARVKPDIKRQESMTLLSDGDCALNRHPSIIIAFQTLEEKFVKVIFGLSLENKEKMSYINVTTKVSFVKCIKLPISWQMPSFIQMFVCKFVGRGLASLNSPFHRKLFWCRGQSQGHKYLISRDRLDFFMTKHILDPYTFCAHLNGIPIIFSSTVYIQRTKGPLVVGKNVCQDYPVFHGLLNQVKQ